MGVLELDDFDDQDIDPEIEFDIRDAEVSVNSSFINEMKGSTW